mmetsp:Transcript_12978/g.41612  ORF Transcript_12978/g.41612 Transcript_12978/m.41612 type:complete len:241 (+) Transcript_12978:454-1176(+)
MRGSASGLPARRTVCSFFGESEPSSIGTWRTWLPERSSAASIGREPMPGGRREMRLAGAARVERCSISSYLHSGSDSSALSPSCTATSPTSGASGAAEEIWLCDTSTTCSCESDESEGGSSRSSFFAASRLRSLGSDANTSGSAVSALLETMSVVRWESWPSRGGSEVSAPAAISSRSSCRQTQFHSAGSTVDTPGSGSLPRSDSSRLVSDSTALTSPHTGSGASASAACRASAACTFLR